MTHLLRLFARALDAFLAPPSWQFESASWSTDSRGGGDEPARPPLAVQADRPRGCTPGSAS